MKKLVCTILLSAAILAVLWYVVPTLGQSKPLSVKIISPVQKTVYETAACSGTLQSAHTARLTIGAPAQIIEILVSEGDTVAAGQPILKYRLLPTEEAVLQAGGIFTREIAERLRGLSDGLHDDSLLAAAEYAAASGELPDYFKDFYLPATASAETMRSGILYAPFDGTLTMLASQKAGDIVSGAFISAVVEDCSNIIAALRVPESYLSQLHTGQNVNITGAAFGTHVFAGRILEIGSHAITTGGLLTKSETCIEATAAIYTDQLLMSGLTVKGCIFLNEHPNALLIPHAAVATDADGSEFVYLYVDGFAVRKPIAYTYETNDGVVVSDGFSVTDQLIANPPHELYDGCPVAAVQTDLGVT